MFDLISISEAIKRSYDSEGLLVDVRSEEVFKKGHLPMAVNLPFEEIMNEKFDIEAIEKDFNIEKEQPVFLYCDTGSTRRTICGRWCVLLDIATFPKYNYNY